MSPDARFGSGPGSGIDLDTPYPRSKQRGNSQDGRKGKTEESAEPCDIAIV